MGWDGMLGSEGSIPCNRCGEPLNPHGHRPAELYAGTYTGLCYRCQNSSAFCTHVELLDMAEHWEFPPHCPSWRRDRESYVGYSDCNDCDGRGSKWVSRSDPQGGSYRTYCDACFSRYYNHPVRKRISQRRKRISNAWMNATVNHLLCSRLASRRKRQSNNDGIKKKDHNGSVIWIYCSESTVESCAQQFKERASRLTEKYCHHV